MNEIMIDLQGGAKAPLYEKIYEYIKNEIVDGKISKGEKLPSTRLLAKNLSVSRSTVELAYDQLLAEGYIEAEPYRGYFVCDIEALYQLEQRNHMQEKLQAGQSWQPGWKTETEKKVENLKILIYYIKMKNKATLVALCSRRFEFPNVMRKSQRQ